VAESTGEINAIIIKPSKNEKKHQKIESDIHVGRTGDGHGRFGLGLPVPVGIFAPKISFLSFLRKKAGSHTP
jgi:hypothetical protein